jgi:hypothetical protein
MKIEFNSMEYLARKIVCDLNRENMLSKGYELIGYLSWMIRDELNKYCEHYWIALPRPIPFASYDLSPIHLDEPTKICKKCGEIYQ